MNSIKQCYRILRARADGRIRRGTITIVLAWVGLSIVFWMPSGVDATHLVHVPQADATLTPTETMTPTRTMTPTPGVTPLTLPAGCRFQSLLLEVDKDYTVLTFRCPNATRTKTPTGD